MRIPTLFTLLILAVPWSSVQAQDNVPLESFLSLSKEQLETVALRLEYLGPSSGLLPTVVITVEGHSVNLDAFRSLPGGKYEVQSKPAFTVASQEMKNFLGGSISSLIKEPSEKSAAPWLGLTVVAGSNAPFTRFLHTFDMRQANDLFVYMRAAFRADPKDIAIINGGINGGAMARLQSFGCATGLVSNTMPAKDVTSQFIVTHGGLRFNYQEHRFESVVTLTNISPRPVRGPISLVVDMSPGSVQLANAHGHTCIMTPVGRAFITLPMPQASLNAGQVLETLIWFTDSAGEDITFSTKVVAGAGDR
jgi:hypothetical protein